MTEAGSSLYHIITPEEKHNVWGSFRCEISLFLKFHTHVSCMYKCTYKFTMAIGRHLKFDSQHAISSQNILLNGIPNYRRYSTDYTSLGGKKQSSLVSLQSACLLARFPHKVFLWSFFSFAPRINHYSNIIMSAMASQITGVSILYPVSYSGV